MSLSSIKANKYLVLGILIILVIAIIVSVIFTNQKKKVDYPVENPNIDFTKLTPKEIQKIKEKYEPGEILVLFKDFIKSQSGRTYSTTEIIPKDELLKSNYSTFFNDINKYGLVSAENVLKDPSPTSKLRKYYLIKLDKAADIESVINSCNSHTSDIETCDKNNIAQTYALPNDPRAGQEWHLTPNGSNVIKAWDITTGNVKIGDIDDCFNPNHEDLKDVYANTLNAKRGCHGEETSGTAAAKGNNGLGVSGVCQNCPTYGYESFDSSALVQHFNQAVKDGVKVMNMSWGIHAQVGGGIKLAAQEAYDSGMVLIAAAGNCLNEEPSPQTCGFIESPQDWEFVLTAGAYDSSQQAAIFTSYYESRKTRGVTSPGVGILTTSSSNNRQGGSNSAYSAVDGTSFSSPATVGVAALILSVYPTAKPNVVNKIILSTAIDMGAKGADTVWGLGKVDAYAAVDCAKKMSEGTITECPTNNTVPPNPTPEPNPNPNPGPGPSPQPQPTPQPTPVPVPNVPGGEVPVPSNGSPIPSPTPTPTPQKPQLPNTGTKKDCDPTIGNLFCFL